MTIRFTKMHGLGNDFIVIDAVSQQVNLQPDMIQQLSRRDTGIGFDQCLLVEASKDSETDFFYRIYNVDGKEVGQCGNGARCLARFIHQYNLSKKETIAVSTSTTKMILKLNKDHSVTVKLEIPKLNPVDIPLKVNKLEEYYQLPLITGVAKVHAINVGNPHAVTIVDNLVGIDLANLGKEISEHALFPEQTNAGFMKIINPSHLQLRVYERGCGETQACGSGAVAAAAVGRLWHKMAEEIMVSLPGGDLRINWPDVKGPIYLTGPATFVYEGVLMTTNFYDFGKNKDS
ncbi:MAG: diaminopimelate epimerase [Tatlockia sp.]|nr:diaminopimelate epimerase [Tatlockia sp.]